MLYRMYNMWAERHGYTVKLMDYLDGDTYYKIKSPDHNLVRTRAQYALLRSAEERYDAMRAIVAELAARP